MIPFWVDKLSRLLLRQSKFFKLNSLLTSKVVSKLFSQKNRRTYRILSKIKVSIPLLEIIKVSKFEQVLRFKLAIAFPDKSCQKKRLEFKTHNHFPTRLIFSAPFILILGKCNFIII